MSSIVFLLFLIGYATNSFSSEMCSMGDYHVIWDSLGNDSRGSIPIGNGKVSVKFTPDVFSGENFIKISSEQALNE